GFLCGLVVFDLGFGQGGFSCNSLSPPLSLLETLTGEGALSLSYSQSPSLQPCFPTSNSYFTFILASFFVVGTTKTRYSQTEPDRKGRNQIKLRILIAVIQNPVSHAIQCARSLHPPPKSRECVDIGVLKLGICLGYRCLSDREFASNGKFLEKLKGAGLFLIKLFGVLAVSPAMTAAASGEIARTVVGILENNFCLPVLVPSSLSQIREIQNLESCNLMCSKPTPAFKKVLNYLFFNCAAVFGFKDNIPLGVMDDDLLLMVRSGFAVAAVPVLAAYGEQIDRIASLLILRFVNV
ncbi:hypothetical protein S83_046378, partial [Arachis hypogaea]